MERQTNKGAPPQLQHAAAMTGEDVAEASRTKEDLLFHVERLLRERIQEQEQRVDENLGDNLRDVMEVSEATAGSFSVQQEETSGKSFWLTHCRGVSAADAFAALECLHVVRECVALQPTAGAGGDSSCCAVRLPVYLYTLLECIHREAAAARDNGLCKKRNQEDHAAAANAASRITEGMALLLVMLLQQLSPEGLHKTVHNDPKIFMLLLKAIDACSTSEKATSEAATRGCSPRPLLLLLTSVQHCFLTHHTQQQAGDTSIHDTTPSNSYSHNGSSSNSSTSFPSSSGSSSSAPTGPLNVCSCFPARGVWQQLLQLLTSDARSSVRHRARQTAQALFQVAATEASGTAATFKTAEEGEVSGSVVGARGVLTTGMLKRQHHARASVMACLSELQKYVNLCQLSSAGEVFYHHEERVWQKTRFMRILPFVRRVLVSLLQLPLVVGSPSHHESSCNNSRNDEKVHEVTRNNRHGDVDGQSLLRQAERSERAYQMLLLAVRDICIQTAFLNKPVEFFTIEAAQGVRCVVGAVAEALQQQLLRCEAAGGSEPQEQQHQAERNRSEDEPHEAHNYWRKEVGGMSSFVPDLHKLLVLPLAAQLLSGLLQQQCCTGTNTSSRNRGNRCTSVMKESTSSVTSGGLWEAAIAAEVVVSSNIREKGKSSTAALCEAAAQASGTAGGAGAAEYAAAWCAAVSTALEVFTRWTGLPGDEEIFSHEEADGGMGKAPRNKHSAFASQQKSHTCEGESGNSSRRDGRGDVASPADEMRETELLLEQLQRLTLLPQPEEGHTSERLPLHKNTLGTAGLPGRGDQGPTSGATIRTAGAGEGGIRRAAEGEAATADAFAGQTSSYPRRAELCFRVWRRVMKSLCEGLAVVRDSSVASAIAAAGKRLMEQATLLELPLLDAAVPYCMSLLHYKQKQHWYDALQQAAQLFHSLELVALKQFSRGSPCFPQLQRLASRALRPETHRLEQQLQQQEQPHHKQQLRQEQQEGTLADYMDAFADMYLEAFEPLLERIVIMLSIVESGAPPNNSSNTSKKSRAMQANGVYSTSTAKEAEDSREQLASLQRRDMAMHRGDLRSCFAAALHAFTCRVLLSKKLLPLVFFMEVSDLSQTDLVIFDERAATAQAAESCRISSSDRSHSVEWCSNSWLLPLLPGCLKRDRLGLFAAYFYPIARQLQQQARLAFTLGKPLQARELCRLQQQVWGLLPGFCCQPLDLARALSSQQGSRLFDSMLQLLHEPVLRQDICTSIANLCAAVAVPPCAAAAAASVAIAGDCTLRHEDGLPAEAPGVEIMAASKTPTDSASSAKGELVDARADEARERRAAALLAVLRSAMQKGCSGSLMDEDGATALAAVAGSGCSEGRRILQQRAAPVIGFLVVRYLQVHKLPAGGPGGLAGAALLGTATTATSQQQRSFLAAMLLGEKESFENLTQSAKMKAAQHLLRAIKAYAPLCPKELLNANVRRFTSAFLNRATTAAIALGAATAVSSASAEATKAAAQSASASTGVLGPTETAALVDITDALLPMLFEEFTVETIRVLRDLLEICVGGLKKQSGPQTGAAEKGQIACTAVELLVHRQVLQVLLRRAYKTLKHILERSLEQLRQLSRQQEELRQRRLHQQRRLISGPEDSSFGKQPSAVVRSKDSTPLVGYNISDPADALPGGVGARLSPPLLMELWKVLEPGRAISWIASAEKARLGCLRAFVCYCLAALAHAEKAARTGIEGSCNDETPNLAAVASTERNEAAVAEWGALVENSLLPVLVPEILLCLKTPNRVVRDTALDALSAVAEACEDDREKLSGLVLRVAAGLGGCFGGDLPLMKAAAALALSRLLLSFSEEMGKELVTEVADVVLVMLEDDNTPAFLGALHFAKVLVHVLDADQLESFLPAILNLFESTAVVRARMKIRRLLEKILKKLGDATVEAAFPKKHLPLLRHVQRCVRKQQLRNLLCNAALHEGLTWEELDFGVGNSTKKEEMGQQAGQCMKQSASKQAKQQFTDMLDEEEDDDDDDEESEQEEEEEGRGGRLGLQKSLRKKGASVRGGQKKSSHGDADAVEEKGDAATGGVKPGGVVSVYLREMLDAVDGTDRAERQGGKKRTRGRASAEPVSLAEDQTGDTPLDLLSPAAAERILLSRCMRKRRRQETVQMDGTTGFRETAARESAAHTSKEEEVYWNEEGRLVVVDAEGRSSIQIEKRKASEKLLDAKRHKLTRVPHPVGNKAGGKLADSKRPTLSNLAARRAAVKAAKQQKRGGHFVQQGAEAFKSKKARGDVMRNKKIEPFAYIRLNPAMIREKYRPKALKSLSAVFTKHSRRRSIAAASRGVHKGLRRRSRRSKEA